MGRRDRERKQAIQQGKVLSIREEHDALGFQVLRGARARMFAKYYVDNTDPPSHPEERSPLTPEDYQRLCDELVENATQSIVDVLPETLRVLGRNQFHERELESLNDGELVAFGVLGVVASGRGSFRMMDRHADVWGLKKRRGRLRNGVWKFCSWCGMPIYTTPSTSHRRWHIMNCRRAEEKYRRLKRQPTLLPAKSQEELPARLREWLDLATKCPGHVVSADEVHCQYCGLRMDTIKEAQRVKLLQLG